MQDRKNLRRLQFTDEEKGAPRLKERPKAEPVLVPEQAKGKRGKQAARPGQKQTAEASAGQGPAKAAERPAPQERARPSGQQAGQEPVKGEQPKTAPCPALSPESRQPKAHLRFDEGRKPAAAPKLAHDPKRPVVTAAHRKIAEVEDDNVGVESAHAAEITAEDGVHRARASYRVRRTRLKNNSIRETGSKKGTAKPIQSGVHSNPISRRFQKRTIQKQYAAARRGAVAAGTAASAERRTRKTVKAGARASAFVVRHKKGILGVLAVFLVCAFFMNTFSSCSVIVGGTTEALAATTYPSEDSDMLGAEAAYCGMEQELQRTLDNYQRTHDYDEYHFDLDEIKHDPYVLISYLTAWMGGAWTLDEVQDTLGMIFDRQYILTEDVRSETRYRTETKTGTRQRTDPNTGQTYSEEYEYEARVPYTYTICYVSLENFNLSHLPIYTMSEKQMSMYAMYMSCLGNRPDLFPGSEYIAKYSGGGLDYKIPPEALEDEVFARMMEEAQKYIGYPYVWGGSNPSTSFDCSGFVSWVINHSGWNYGRLGATALYYIGTPVSYANARPGDLVFFQGTYDTDGYSHCGIYVGNGIMLHCGDPIGYADLSLPYWQAHLAGFCRLPSTGG